MRATELVLRRLLTLAYDGLATWGVERSVAEHYLGIIESRCLGGTNGAEWFVRQMAVRDDMDRYDAIREVLAVYREGMHANAPVHTW